MEPSMELPSIVSDQSTRSLPSFAANEIEENEENKSEVSSEATSIGRRDWPMLIGLRSPGSRLRVSNNNNP